jgi:hypothetical protein
MTKHVWPHLVSRERAIDRSLNRNAARRRNRATATPVADHLRLDIERTSKAFKPASGLDDFFD